MTICTNRGPGNSDSAQLGTVQLMNEITSFLKQSRHPTALSLPPQTVIAYCISCSSTSPSSSKSILDHSSSASAFQSPPICSANSCLEILPEWSVSTFRKSASALGTCGGTSAGQAASVACLSPHHQDESDVARQQKVDRKQPDAHSKARTRKGRRALTTQILHAVLSFHLSSFSPSPSPLPRDFVRSN